MSDTTITKVVTNKPKAKKTYKPNSYRVTNEFLFYKICDAGIGYTYLHGVNVDKDGVKTFHFDRNEEIKTIIDKFNAQERITE